MSSLYINGIKPIFDLVFACLGVLVLGPLFVVIGFIIKMTSKGPVFYKQQRMRKGGRTFELLKFRSMVIDADQKGLLITAKHDPRIMLRLRLLMKKCFCQNQMILIKPT